MQNNFRGPQAADLTDRPAAIYSKPTASRENCGLAARRP